MSVVRGQLVAANNKRIKSVFLPHYVTMDSIASTHELHLSPERVPIGVKTLRNVVDFKDITDNSVNDEMSK